MNKREYFSRQQKRYKEGELKYCAEKVRELWPDDVKHILRIADEAVRLEFIFDLPWDMERTYQKETFEHPINWTYMAGQDEEFAFQMNRHRYFICLGQAYAMTGEEKYAQAFVKIAEDWMEHVPLTKESKAITWRQIEAGLRGENWTKAMLYFEQSPLVTDEFVEKFTSCLKVHGDYLAESRRGFQISSNWGVLENQGLLCIGLSLGEERYVELAVSRLEEEARIQVFPDGVHWEQSCMYHNEVLHCFLEAIGSLQTAGRKIPDQILESALRMSEANVAWMKPDRCQPLMGDSDETDLRDMFAAAAIILGRAGYQEAGIFKGVGYAVPDYESIWNFREEGMKIYEEITGRIPSQTDFFLEDSGNYYIRSGWEQDAEYLHFRNGCLGGGHGHSDKLHIDVTSKGEDVLVDGGRYQYTYKEENRIWLKSIHAHNTILVDGMDYMEYPDPWTTLTMAPELRYPVIRRGGFTLLEGGHTGYLQKGVNVLLTRKLIVLEPGVYVVQDFAYTSEAHTYSRLFHFNNRGEVTYGNDRVLYKGEKAKMELVFPGENCNLIHCDSKLSRHYNFCEKNDAVKADTTAEGRTAMFTVLAANQEKEIRVSVCPVWNPVRNCNLEAEYAQALKVETDRHQYTIIFRNQDLAGPCDLLQVEDCMGIGRLLISADGEKTVSFG